MLVRIFRKRLPPVAFSQLLRAPNLFSAELPRWGSLQRFSRLPSWFKGNLLLRVGEEEEDGREGKRRREEKKGIENGGDAPVANGIRTKTHRTEANRTKAHEDISLQG